MSIKIKYFLINKKFKIFDKILYLFNKKYLSIFFVFILLISNSNSNSFENFIFNYRNVISYNI